VLCTPLLFACVLPSARRATGELLRTVVQHRGVWGVDRHKF
jgi:hypothetical protein